MFGVRRSAFGVCFFGWPVVGAIVCLLLGLSSSTSLAQNQVYVSRFWHCHQPIYWPEWNGNGSQTSRVQYAWDSIVLQNGQTYGTGSGHPSDRINIHYLERSSR